MLILGQFVNPLVMVCYAIYILIWRVKHKEKHGISEFL